MPNKYTRKMDSTRGAWTEESLKNAFEAVKNGQSIRKASEKFGIPRRTLANRLKKGDTSKGSMGPGSCLGKENEEKLVEYIKQIQEQGMQITTDDLRKLAFIFAKHVGAKHKFDNVKEKAGYSWLELFLARHPEITPCKTKRGKPEGVKHTEVELETGWVPFSFDALPESSFVNNSTHFFKNAEAHATSGDAQLGQSDEPEASDMQISNEPGPGRSGTQSFSTAVDDKKNNLTPPVKLLHELLALSASSATKCSEFQNTQTTTTSTETDKVKLKAEKQKSNKKVKLVEVVSPSGSDGFQDSSGDEIEELTKENLEKYTQRKYNIGSCNKHKLILIFEARFGFTIRLG